ncbi:MAG TPA: substrate-binding domain-containing protein [Acidobacteriaceae bacterium]|nr:substrate-binding domain-containing protein [Acidobacteriaceae bacterium]
MLSLPAALCLFATGCERHAKSETYYLIANNLGVPYWKTVVSGFDRAATAYGVTDQVDGPNNYDVQAELQALTKAVAAKPAGILISVSDPVVLEPQIDSAIEAGIPVVTVDSDAPGIHRLFFVGTNNLEAGRLGGQRAVEKLGDKGNVVFFSMPGQPNLDERLKGYQDVFSAHPGVKVIDVINIKGDSGNAFDRAQQYLAETGPKKIDAFICLESSSAKDVAEALKRQNATDRLLIAMDVDQDTLNLIKAGVIEATVAQKPYTMGYYGLISLDEVHHYPPKSLQADFSSDSFSPYPEFVDTGTALVDKSNVDSYIRSAAEAQKK